MMEDMEVVEVDQIIQNANENDNEQEINFPALTPAKLNVRFLFLKLHAKSKKNIL